MKLTSVLPRRSLFTDTCSIYAVSNNSCYDINYRTDRFKSWIGTNSDVRHSVARYGITVILMRFHFDERKSVNAGEKGVRFSRSRPEPVIQREPRSTGTR